MKKNKKLNESIMHNLNEADEATLDKDILVYDINAFIDKEINPKQDVKYKAFDWDGGAAILIKQDGSGCIVDYEAIGTKFDNTSKQVSVTICPEGEDDGNGHMSFYIMPTASFKATIDELMTAPSKPMKVRDFFTKYNYNDRCERNFAGIEDYVINNVNTNSMNEAYDDYTNKGDLADISYKTTKTKINESTYIIKQIAGPFGVYKVCEWEADSPEQAISEFLDMNPSYKDGHFGKITAVLKENDSLNEADVTYEFARESNTNDFIADGTYTFGEKIRYIADQLEESGNVDVYEDKSYNEYLLNVANILHNAANEIDKLR